METLSDDIREVTDMEIGCDYLAPNDVKDFIKRILEEDGCGEYGSAITEDYKEGFEHGMFWMKNLIKNKSGDVLLGADE